MAVLWIRLMRQCIRLHPLPFGFNDSGWCCVMVRGKPSVPSPVIKQKEILVIAVWTLSRASRIVARTLALALFESLLPDYFCPWPLDRESDPS